MNGAKGPIHQNTFLLIPLWWNQWDYTNLCTS